MLSVIWRLAYHFILPSGPQQLQNIWWQSVPIAQYGHLFFFVLLNSSKYVKNSMCGFRVKTYINCSGLSLQFSFFCCLHFWCSLWKSLALILIMLLHFGTGLVADIVVTFFCKCLLFLDLTGWEPLQYAALYWIREVIWF